MSNTEQNELMNFYGAEGKAKEILTHIGTRRARRRLTGEPVSGDAVKRILEAARWAPSCANNQPWRYFVCAGEDAVTVRQALLGGNYWADEAPIYIVAAVDRSASCRLDDDREYALMDLGMSIMNLLLQVHAEGLVGHPMAGMSPVKVKELLGIEDNYRVMAVISVSVGGGERELSERHEASEAVTTARNPIEDMLFNPEVLEAL